MRKNRQNEQSSIMEKSREKIAKKMSRQSAKRKRIDERIARDRQAEELDVSLRVLEMDQDFREATAKYANWPQPVRSEESTKALTEFRNRVDLDELREHP